MARRRRARLGMAPRGGRAGGRGPVKVLEATMVEEAVARSAGGEAAGPSSQIFVIGGDRSELGVHLNENAQPLLERLEEKLEAKQNEMEAELNMPKAKHHGVEVKLLSLIHI
eukprot:14642633-Alexandrium_andersonii.AAC.1